MNERSPSWLKFVAEHPFCAFCGLPAETEEHCPPRSLFQERIWPEGFNFPACLACNSGTRNDDLVIAVLSRVDPLGTAKTDDGKLTGYMHRLREQRPGLLEGMQPTVREARRHNAAHEVKRLPGQSHREACRVLKITPEIAHIVSAFARKLAKAIFYKEAEQIFPTHGCLILTWETNVELVRNGDFEVFRHFRDLPGFVPTIKRDRRPLADQFVYKWMATEKFERTLLQAKLGQGLALVVAGSVNPGELEKYIEELRASGNDRGQAIVLQSSRLAPFDHRPG